MKKSLFLILFLLTTSVFADNFRFSVNVGGSDRHNRYSSHHPYYPQYGGCYPYSRVYYPNNVVIYYPQYQPVYVSEERIVVVKERAPVVAPQTISPYQMGRNWAKDYRNDIITFDQLVAYVKDNIKVASASDFTDFRQGFIEAYGVNGEQAFNKVLQEARN